MLELLTRRTGRGTFPEGDGAVAAYIAAYQSLLSSGEEVSISRIEGLHRSMASSLHREAESPRVCISAFLYSLER